MQVIGMDLDFQALKPKVISFSLPPPQSLPTSCLFSSHFWSLSWDLCWTVPLFIWYPHILVRFAIISYFLPLSRSIWSGFGWNQVLWQFQIINFQDRWGAAEAETLWTFWPKPVSMVLSQHQLQQICNNSGRSSWSQATFSYDFYLVL